MNNYVVVGKKCTYGKKCKFFHPESSRSVVETMKENSDRRYRTSVEAVALANEFINNPATTNVTSKSSTVDCHTTQHVAR